MYNFKDLTGLRFGKRVVISREPSSRHNDGSVANSRWLVKCDCGKEYIVSTPSLKHHSSCGCDLSYIAATVETKKKRRGQRRTDSPTYKQEGHLLRTFNKTLEWRNEQITVQNNKCAICEREFVYTPHIDHDHECCSGKTSCGKCIRSLLCHNCNTAIGNLKDSPELLRKAATYLEEWKIKHRQREVAK